MREHLALTPTEVSACLERAKEDGHSALLLSTCNRFELYWYGDEVREASFLEFARSRGAGDRIPLDRWDGLAAARHIFTVAAGLDSQVLGETEILGQVRRAFDLARAAGTTTREMDLVFSSRARSGAATPTGDAARAASVVRELRGSGPDDHSSGWRSHRAGRLSSSARERRRRVCCGRCRRAGLRPWCWSTVAHREPPRSPTRSARALAHGKISPLSPSRPISSPSRRRHRSPSSRRPSSSTRLAT